MVGVKVDITRINDQIGKLAKKKIFLITTTKE